MVPAALAALAVGAHAAIASGRRHLLRRADEERGRQLLESLKPGDAYAALPQLAAIARLTRGALGEVVQGEMAGLRDVARLPLRRTPDVHGWLHTLVPAAG